MPFTERKRHERKPTPRTERTATKDGYFFKGVYCKERLERTYVCVKHGEEREFETWIPVRKNATWESVEKAIVEWKNKNSKEGLCSK